MDIESRSYQNIVKKESWRTVLTLAYQSLGVVYGDLSTSPLYVYKSTFAEDIHHTESNDEIFGVLSFIFWTITLVPLFKYVFIVLRADDNGEGGTFALYSLLCRHARVNSLPSCQLADEQLIEYNGSSSEMTAQSGFAARLKCTLEKHRVLQKVLLVLALIGTCMVIGDGVLTPAISVFSAVSGVELSTAKEHHKYPPVPTQVSYCNLVANSFTLEGLDNRVLSGLNCLQKNFPCNRGKGIYYNFSINCGGPDKRSVSRALFERDDADLGPSSFFVNAARRWAASSIGLFAGSSSNAYIASSLSQFTNTSDSELFQTARLSASSLRYYGLGLENGGYTVTLQFAEIQMEGSNSWKGVGRRRFDIYVQGRLVEKDFDVRRTAGGSTNRAVHREYKANVTENYLEVHLFWAGKGTCCIPIQGAYGPIISAVSATPELLSMEIKPYTFTYSELKSATQDFNLSNKLGEGGFGPVYKARPGNLKDGREVAVKLLSVGSRQGKGQFVAEIVTISTVLHRNLVTLYGCCFEGDHRLLVYEYLPNGSLDQALFGERSLHLDWSTRFEICLGVARGLVYLHEEARVRIVHRDVKASNILLDSELVPKVSDFGLAKLYHGKKTHISTGVAGTIGYLAPEYAMRGHLTEKTDVYAFGVVALELVSGRPNSDEILDDEKKYLLEWVRPHSLAWNLHEKGREVELIDDRLSEFNVEEVKRVIGVALLCTQASHSLRPPMSRVVAMLSGDVEVSDVTSKPGYLTDWRFDDITRDVEVSHVTFEPGYLTDWRFDDITTSLSSFQTTETNTSGSKISPRKADSEPMLGAQDQFWKRTVSLL
ncbi:hypothetical protein F2Q69_00020433 [Brassica cretica]|uniref:non-specific serine/threonine protein kinase n=1 Tax=Brassica cretica TaxID=69181 RepID=A0A8S9QGE8_BRACR|nr:hypothetical protein F2Q69_00020433 [Brassica cretica]